MVAALGSLNTIVDEKWISTYQMDDAIKTRKEGDDLKATITRFYAANKEWERLHEQLASTLRLDVNSQFGIDAGTEPFFINTDCLSYTLNRREPTARRRCRSALCWRFPMMLTTSSKAGSTKSFRRGPRTISVACCNPGIRAVAGQGRTRLSHIWSVNKVLQCLMLERALELRRRSPQVPIIPSQMPLISLASSGDSKSTR